MFWNFKCLVNIIIAVYNLSNSLQKQKRVKIVSVGPDGQCHELAKAHIPQGKGLSAATGENSQTVLIFVI